MIARQCWFLLLAVVLVVGISGCPGSDEIGKTIPVTGKVTIDGRPLESGNVTFIPTKDNKTKAGVSGIVKGGEYTLVSGTSTANRSGAPPGWYKVTISTTPSGMTAPPAGAGKVEPGKGDKLNQPGLENQGKAAPIAEKYTDPTKTPLEVEVKSGGNFDLEAKSR